ncbi:MAG TPA: response regulator [Dehalococcoidia bacterium]|nr:response regulator [Dehalococcoidia bacterium]
MNNDQSTGSIAEAARGLGQRGAGLSSGMGCRLGHWLLNRKYRLTTVFGLAALIFILTAAAVISNTIARITENNLVRIAERGITTDAVAMLSMLRDASQPLTVEALAASNELPRALPGLVQKYSVVKLQLVDPTGRIAWSTDRKALGVIKHLGPSLQRAMAGQIASKFSGEHQLADLGGWQPSISIVESYLPLRDPSTGRVVGVLEIYRNVTDDVPFIVGSTRTSILRVTALTMAALFLVLLIVAGVADVIISRSKRREQTALETQLAERRQAADALMESNQKLEEVVQELKGTQQQIIQQERLRALGEMASGIAHDFNNALTPILGFASLLLNQPDRLTDVERVKKHLQIILTSAEDAASVVARLKEFYRQQDVTDQFTSQDLPELAKLAISITQAKWKDQARARGATINVASDFLEVPSILGDAPRIREALINLIMNAVDAMPAGGTITLGTYTEGNFAVLSVGDTEQGMTEEVKRRCLEPFFTTKGSLGTGMGLSMVYGIIQRHGGSMEIESEIGMGTTFIMRFPIPREPAQAEVDQVVEPNASPPLHLLVVDDEPMVALLLTAFLTNDGHHSVVTAADGRLGLEKFQSERFDLVLTDRAMPEMNGDQLAASIKEISPQTPVIMLTGFGDFMSVTGEKPAGADIVLGKPVTMDGLRQGLAAAMKGSKAGSIFHEGFGKPVGNSLPMATIT